MTPATFATSLPHRSRILAVFGGGFLGLASWRGRKDGERDHALSERLAVGVLRLAAADRDADQGRARFRDRDDHHLGGAAALGTYMGHVNIYATYWYLEATADLMRDVAAAGEDFICNGRQS